MRAVDVADGEHDDGFSSASASRRAMRKYTEAQRAQIVAESLEAGAGVIAVARRHGVRPNLLSYWRALSRTTGRTSKSAPVAARLARVRVAASAPMPSPSTTDGVIEIDLDQRCIRVRGAVSSALLREVLAATRC